MEDQTGKTYCGDSAGRPSLFHIRTDVYSTDNDAMPMSVKGSVKFSENGKDWILAETFEFGNLKNDPTCRYHYFKKPAKARYIRIETNEKITKDAIEYDLF